VAVVLAIILFLVAALAFVLGRASQFETAASSTPVVSKETASFSEAKQEVEVPAPEIKAVANPEASEPEKPKTKAEFSAAEQRLIDAYFKGEDMCRGSIDPKAGEIWCPRRDAAYVAMTKAGICYGHEDDQSAAAYKIHRCRKGSIR
jgi:hypothetical protein